MYYLNPFDNQEVETYTVKTFGESVRQRRNQLNISVRQMAANLGMSAVYLSEIERGNRPAPTGSNSKIDYMSLLKKELRLTDSQAEVFFIMAQVSHMNKKNLFVKYFANNSSSFKFFLTAIEKNWSNEQWEELYKSIDW